ncbi:MAG: hypothetical protein GY820_08560 [Gammaproteobacteria bacterium]|nr:hypothetical protein [Gammaproteobacteria bacterium]
MRVSITESAFVRYGYGIFGFCILSSFKDLLCKLKSEMPSRYYAEYGKNIGDFPEKQRKLRAVLCAVALHFWAGFDSTPKSEV